MNSESFTQWLKGYSQICDNPPNQDEWHIIMQHLDICSKKEIPDKDNIRGVSTRNLELDMVWVNCQKAEEEFKSHSKKEEEKDRYQNG